MFWNKRTYLDTAAGVSANPSSPHEEGRQAKEKLESARTTIARLTEVQPDDIIFTSGATEANALAILGYVRALRARGMKNVHVLYLPSAHASIVENVKMLSEEGVEIEELPLIESRVDIEALEKLLRKETVLVSMEAVCGETGVVWNTREVAEVLKVFRTGALKKESAQAARPMQHSFFNAPVLHVDASQAPFTEKLFRAHFNADLLTLDASKISEARGIGALIAHRTIPITPFFKGGGQERGVRPGSEAPELIDTFAKALVRVTGQREAFREKAHKQRKQLLDFITKNISNVWIQEGKNEQSQAPHILNLSLPGRDTDYLVAVLNEAGYAVSTRSACETDSENGSRAVLALTNDPERARATLRISWGPEITARDLRLFAKELAQAVVFIDSGSKR